MKMILTYQKLLFAHQQEIRPSYILLGLFIVFHHESPSAYLILAIVSSLFFCLLLCDTYAHPSMFLQQLPGSKRFRFIQCVMHVCIGVLLVVLGLWLIGSLLQVLYPYAGNMNMLYDVGKHLADKCLYAVGMSLTWEYHVWFWMLTIISSIGWVHVILSEHIQHKKRILGISGGILLVLLFIY